MKRRTPRTKLLLYILLNMVVSAGTTLAVLTVWDRAQRQGLPPFPTFEAPAATLPPVEPTAAVAAAPTPSPMPGQPLIEIASVVGATDPKLEYVLLKRLGDVDLDMAGWTLSDEQDNRFTMPALVLYAGGAVRIYTRSGTDTPAEMFWNRLDPVWEPGEWAVLRDAQGNEQARYQVP